MFKFTRNSQFVSPLCSSACQNFSSVWGRHSFHKTMLVSSFSIGWLKRSLAHCYLSLNLLNFIKIPALRAIAPKPSANI